MSIDIAQFIALVRRSKLVENDRLDEALARLQPLPADPATLTTELVAAEVLTAWQCERLQAGRYKGFFLGRYKLVGHLGTGGTSSVFLAEHLVTQHQVAIKVLPPTEDGSCSYSVIEL